MTKQMFVTTVAVAGMLMVGGGTARADNDNAPKNGCKDLPSQSALRSALASARAQANGGFNLDMWATIVDRDGVVCAVAFTGNNRGDQWPGSRVISAQKANTANAFSLARARVVDRESLQRGATRRQPVRAPGKQPGERGSGVRRESRAVRNHQRSDGRRTHRRRECVRRRPGALQRQRTAPRRPRRQRRLVVRGSQHRVADARHAESGFRARRRERRPVRKDNIVYDITPQAGQMPGVSASGWGQPHCVNPAAESAIAAGLPPNE